MVSLPTPPSESSWTANPVRDFLCYRLVRLAVCALDASFTDPEVEAEYRRWQKSAARKRRPRGGADVLREIRSWERPGGYTMRVLAQSKWGEFVVAVEEEDFRAEVMAIYDIEAFDVTAAGVESFTGDAVKAIEVAHRFATMLEIEADAADEDEDMTPEFQFGVGTADGPLQEIIRDRVESIVARLAGVLAGRPGEGILAEDEHFLVATPGALWAIRDGFIARARAGLSADSAVLSAWQNLLEKQLEEIRFKAERKHAWALDMIDRYQSDLLAMARGPGVEINTWQALVIALDRAKIQIRADVRAASLDLASGAGRGPAAVDIMHSLEEIVESGGGDPFRIAHHLFDAMTMMPPDFANAGVMMISEAPLPALRDVLPLVLLAPEAACRQAAGAALELMAAEKRLTPAGLRRLIAVRSWLPEAERPTVDQAIRKARLAGVDCAPWPAGQVRALKATVIDGSGCQSVVGLAKDDRRTLFTGILLKQGFGVRDVMLERGLSRRDADAMLASVADRVLTLPVARPYLDRMVQHALWTGVAAGRVPPLELLEVAEIMGAAEWRAQRLDAGVEIEQLLGQLTPAQLTPAAQADAVKRSADLLQHAEIGDSWFEDDESARQVCAAHSRTSKKLIAALLAEVVEPRRDVWVERLVWTALWLKAGGAAPELPSWVDYALVAHAVHGGAPLAEIPLMIAIAKLTATAHG